MNGDGRGRAAHEWVVARSNCPGKEDLGGNEAKGQDERTVKECR